MADLSFVPPGAAPPGLAEAVREAGFGSAEDGPVRLVMDGELDPADVREQVAFVLGGGRLLLLSGAGPLAAALNLRAPGEPLRGPAEPAVDGLPPVEVDAGESVTGVGRCLYRVGEHCAAIGGVRGEGRVGFAVTGSPALVLACLSWICRKPEAGVRSTWGGSPH